MYVSRQEVHVLVRERAAALLDRDGHDQGVPLVEVRSRLRQVVAAAARDEELHRAGGADGQWREMAPPASRRGPGIHGGQAQGIGYSTKSFSIIIIIPFNGKKERK